MKITRIEIANILGLARAELNLPTPILMVAGNNEAGKSTLADAISMAMTGQPRRVKLKKDLGRLLHDSAPKGRVTLMGEGDEPVAMYLLPKGDHTAPEGHRGIKYITQVLDPASFARLDEDERRKLLFSLTGCKVKPDEVEKKLIGRGVLDKIAADIKPMLLGGFPDTAKFCAEQATQQKGVWRGITGENWGSDKSESWEPAEVEPVDPERIESTAQRLAQIQQGIIKGSEHIGQLKGRKQAGRKMVERRQQLEEKAANLQRATAKQDATLKDLTDWKTKQKIAHEEVERLKSAQVGVPCPCCDALLVIQGTDLIEHTGDEADPQALAAAREDLRKANDAVALYSRTLENDKRAIADAESAANELGILNEQAEPVDEEKLARCIEALDELTAEQPVKERELDNLQARALAYKAVSERADKAHAAHSSVKAWLLAAEALSPGGIPSEILSSALSPFNDSLAILARLSGWKSVEVTQDMQVLSGGRLYGLVSESAKWRADALMALAIAQISELKLVVLDRIDVLDIKGRQQLLGLLNHLADGGLMDTMIIAGTLKELPPAASMPKTVTSVWINNAIAEND